MIILALSLVAILAFVAVFFNELRNIGRDIDDDDCD